MTIGSGKKPTSVVLLQNNLILFIETPNINTKSNFTPSINGLMEPLGTSKSDTDKEVSKMNINLDS